MRLNVKCFATLAEKSPPGGACELPEGADVARLMDSLQLPAAEVKIIFINGVAVEPDAVLHDGDRVIMVEDVTTSGKSIDETYPVLKGAADVDVKGLIVSLNRMEVGKGGVVTAQQEVQEKYGFPVASIVSMAEVTECLYNREVQGRVVIDDDVKAALDAYYEQYGVK